jgi:hypothetical protein
MVRLIFFRLGPERLITSQIAVDTCLCHRSAVLLAACWRLNDSWDLRTFRAASAAIAQLGERQTEDLKVPGSIPALGIFWHAV